MSNEPAVDHSEAPDGCLGCNPAPVRAYLEQRGIDPARFSKIPTPRHNWGDIEVCRACEQAWLMERKR